MKIETKYDMGQEVWFMYKLKPFCAKITSLTVYTHNRMVIEYFFEEPFTFVREEYIFRTKQELLDSL